MSVHEEFRPSTLAALCVIAGMILLPWTVYISWAASDVEQRLKEEQQELKELKGRLKTYQHRLEGTKRRERTVLLELEESDRLLQQKGRELQTHERHLKAQTEKQAALLREMEGLTQQWQAREGFLQKRLRVLYKQGRLAYLPFLLSASDVSDFFERVRFTMKLVQHDADLLQQYHVNLGALERTRRAVKERAEQLGHARVRVAAKRDEIEKERLKKNQLLTKIREEQGTYESAVRELEQASSRLMALVAELERQRKQGLDRQARELRQRPGPAQPPPRALRPSEERDGEANAGFAQLRGRLSWPVEGKLVSVYGKLKHPTFNVYTFNKGIGISAPVGSDFRVIDAGQVVYAEWFKGYGNLLIVDHGDSYYSLYAHATELLVGAGEQVKRRQIVGKTGESGSLLGPALYFEIRHHGKPENPLEWFANHRPEPQSRQERAP